MTAISIGIFLVALILVADAAFTVYLALYTWSNPDRFAHSRPPDRIGEPKLSFSLLIPARDEAAVIGETLRLVAGLRYPRHLFETIVICESSDHSTIAAVENARRELVGERLRLVTFEGPPINKPHALNVGLSAAAADVVGIFDAEDEPDPEILNTVNTIMTEESVWVVQSGVQLMNIGSRWYSPLNILEYFFWFKSRLHFFARHRVIPLGGNTVFFERTLMESIGGWNETSLTEDADIGIRLSARGEPIRIVYDDQRVTREETPPTLGALLRQRTRWSQGFLQIATGGQWRKLVGWRRRALALYAMVYPLFQASTMTLLPVSIVAALLLRVPTPVAMASMVPLYLTAFICVIQAMALFEFAQVHKLKRPWRQVISLPFVYMPYNWVLGFAALRALIRHAAGIRNWEKTPHTGVHRTPRVEVPEPFEEAPVAASGGGVAVAMAVSVVEVEDVTSIDA